jgi:hypothetical protein
MFKPPQAQASWVCSRNGAASFTSCLLLSRRAR